MARVYGQWAGNPKGRTENLERCIAEVYTPAGWRFHQCFRKRGYGPAGEYCKQHAKMLEEGRRVYSPKE